MALRISRTVFSALSGTRLLACLIVAPQRGHDEPAILSYAISSFCPTSADGLHDAIRPHASLGYKATSTRGVHGSIRCVTGFAIWIGFAGRAGGTVRPKLTFHLDNSMNAGHRGKLTFYK